MNDIADSLETMILMLLEAKDAKYKDFDETRKIFHKNTLFKPKSMKSFVEEMYPNKTYAADYSIQDFDKAGFFNPINIHPAEILNDECEMAFINKNTIIWIAFRKINKIPKGYSYLGKASFLYEFHVRDYGLNQKSTYSNNICPLDKNGKYLTVYQNGKLFNNQSINNAPNLVSSFVYNSLNSNSMLAEVTDATKVLFPVPLDDYKEVFSKRDLQPTEMRRKAILHWVAKHIRKSVNKNNHLVKKHTRGIDEFTVDGLKVKISANQVL